MKYGFIGFAVALTSFFQLGAAQDTTDVTALLTQLTEELPPCAVCGLLSRIRCVCLKF
jgi:trimethylamine:corrinoid methyltransferase-like protein